MKRPDVEYGLVNKAVVDQFKQHFDSVAGPAAKTRVQGIGADAIHGSAEFSMDALPVKKSELYFMLTSCMERRGWNVTGGAVKTDDAKPGMIYVSCSVDRREPADENAPRDSGLWIVKPR